MISDFDFYESHGDEFDTNKPNTGFIREMIHDYIAAGILLPDKIRHAETILRQLKNKK